MHYALSRFRLPVTVTSSNGAGNEGSVCMCRKEALPVEQGEHVCTPCISSTETSGVGEGSFIFSLMGAVSFGGNKTNL